MSRENPLAPLSEYMSEEEDRRRRRNAMLRITASWITAIMLVSALVRSLFARV
ncbi:MAG TPA: hypothetical protein QF646_02400 [Candidatus Poseidoniales archaeon]|nr:hypothetical protein [Candidatus Poseidoniales archaeon]